MPESPAVTALNPETLPWITRPHEAGESARHVRELSEAARLGHIRANLWRYEPGAVGRRHRHVSQEEVFLVIQGTLTMYVGDPPQPHTVPRGSLITLPAGTPLQSANHGDEDLLVYVHGYPPEDVNAEYLPSAL